MKQLIYTLFVLIIFSCTEKVIIPSNCKIIKPLNNEKIIKGMPVKICILLESNGYIEKKLLINESDASESDYIEEPYYFKESEYDSTFNIYYYWDTSNFNIGTNTIKILFTDANGSKIEDKISVEIIKLPLITNGLFTDMRDGNNYPTLHIGSQIWMSKNLAYLPSVNKLSVGSDTEPYYYVNNYNGTSINEAKATDNYQTFGVLYNWPAAMTACPSGWHLPSDEEWLTLSKVLSANGFGYQGNGAEIAKALAAKTIWKNSSIDPSFIGYNLSTNNQSGFSALPGGSCNILYIRNDASSGYWWTSTEYNHQKAWSCLLNYNSSELSFINGNDKATGYSIRCIRDN
jgi:uncharacterized protein (TIGR02145 family)